jgi:anti-anti-sigma factor
MAKPPGVATPFKVYLIVAKGKKKGFPIPIKVDLFVIGSDKVCQLRCKDTGPEQCAVVTREKKVFLRDWDSGYPTLVNDELVPPGGEWPLHLGDRLTVGNLEFVVQFQEKALSQRDLEEWALRCLDVDNEREGREADEEEEQFMSQRFINASQAAATMFDRLQDMRGIIKGRLRVSHEEGATVLRFNDVNLVEESELALVKKEISDNLTRPNLRVLLDFKNVRRMSSTAVEMLLELFRSLRQRGSTMALCRLRPDLRGEILRTLNVLQPVPHFADKRSALAERW